MLPSPFGGRLGPRGYFFRGHNAFSFEYSPVTRDLPSGDLVDRLRRFCFHLLRYPNYGALTFTPAGLAPAEHASLTWTHLRTKNWLNQKQPLDRKSPSSGELVKIGPYGVARDRQFESVFLQQTV